MSEQKGASGLEKLAASVQLFTTAATLGIASPPKVEVEQYDPHAVPAYVDQLSSVREIEQENRLGQIESSQAQTTISGSPPEDEDDDEYEEEDEDLANEIEALSNQESEDESYESESESESEDSNEESE